MDQVGDLVGNQGLFALSGAPSDEGSLKELRGCGVPLWSVTRSSDRPVANTL
jgi:hypothetical protein